MTLPSHSPAGGRARKLALAVGVAGTAALATAVGAPAAQAAPFTCSASGPSLSLAGQAALNPSTVGSDTAACATATAGIGDLLTNAPLIDVDAITASTKLEGGSTPLTQTASAAGGVAGVNVGSLSGLGLPLGTITGQIPIPAQLQSIKLALPAQVSTLLRPILAAAQLPPALGGSPQLAAALNDLLVNGITVDTQALIRDALTLPDTSVLNLGVTSAQASAKCVNGAASLTGSATVAPVKVLGQTIDVDTPGTQALNLNTAGITFSDVDITKINLPKILTDLGLNGVVQNIVLAPLQSALINQLKASLPAGGIPIPAGLVQLKVTPKSEIRTATTLEEKSLQLQLSLAGQSVLDISTGQAKVGAAGVDCATPVTPTPTAPARPPVAATGAESTSATAAQQLLQCSERRLVLTNVLQRSDRVALFGVADKAFAGQTVQIRFNATKSDVATAKVQPDGTFSTVAPLPSLKLRSTNDARYQARIGTNTSLDLKLQRRMTVTNLDQSGGMVTVKGKLVDPLPVGGASVLISRRVSCTKLEPLKRVKADADGNYEITVPAPAAGQTAVVYRLQSKVRNNIRNKKTYRTYTLPQGIDINK